MTVKKVKKRQIKLLNELMKIANGRHDIKIPLSQVAPTLDIKFYSTGTKFVDKENPLYEGGSDLAYDFSTLLEEGLISRTYMDYKPDGMGGMIAKDDALKLTMDGLEMITDANKSWLTKAIEKQPMTFLQIIVTIIISFASFAGGWAVGRYIMPINKKISTPTVSIKQPINIPNTNKIINNK